MDVILQHRRKPMPRCVSCRISAPICVLAAALLLALSSDVARAQAFTLPPGCTLPFDAIKHAHSIDQTCSPEGSATSAPQAAQNRAKNDFCATGGPVRVTLNTFVQLQTAAEDAGIPFGSGLHLPPDRSLLKDLVAAPSGATVGEGTVVSYIAYIIDAHPSNLSRGESVNCKLPGPDNNDIHIMLGRSPSEDPCRSITAQISPHFRPEAWDEVAEHTLNGHPVKITGPLLFDAPHKPCEQTRGSFARISI